MLEVLDFIFADFWHFIGICVLLVIITMWQPIDITIVSGVKTSDNE